MKCKMNEDNLDELMENDEDFDNESSNETTKIRLEITVDPKQEQLRIDKFIQVRLEGVTRNKVQQSIDEGHILVNNEKVKSNYKVRPGDHIVVFDTRNEDIPTEIIPEDIPLNIVYEDEEVLVVNKSANMVVHPGNGNYTGTLVNAVAYHLQGNNSEVLPRVGLVHRIDKDTTGLLLIAKNEKALVHLQKQFKAHTTHRRYVALVWGDFEEIEGTIEGNIGRDERVRKRMQVFPDGETGKVAITHWKVLEQFYYTSLMEYALETGRTHQIRVHSKFIGHPLFNDSTYGGDRIVKGTIYGKYKTFVENNFKLLPRQALHAKELGFVHPTTNEKMLFKSDLPEDMLTVIDRWRTYAKAITK